MKIYSFPGLLSSLLVSLLMVAGCDKASVKPEPITLEALSPALEKAFAKASPETKDSVSRIGSDLVSKDYSKAYLDLQQLLALPGLSPEQGSVLSRGLLCVNTELQNAQSKGDSKAAETLRFQHMTK